jgi:hypothetical protein
MDGREMLTLVYLLLKFRARFDLSHRRRNLIDDICCELVKKAYTTMFDGGKYNDIPF